MFDGAEMKLMNARWKGIFATFAIVAVPIGILASFFSGWPANHIDPPAIADDLISEKDWNDAPDAGLKLTHMLTKRFPKGTDVNKMRDALLNEGFGPPPRGKVCDSFVDTSKPPPRKEVTNCHYPPNIDSELDYIWGGVPCSQFIEVVWTSDQFNRVSSVTGRYGNMCL
jgi:hypothetical protein